MADIARPVGDDGLNREDGVRAARAGADRKILRMLVGTHPRLQVIRELRDVIKKVRRRRGDAINQRGGRGGAMGEMRQARRIQIVVCGRKVKGVLESVTLL